ncbi:PREDICTED: putative late blight resistance protein homolog R1A-3 [Nicotiana attenuata]|uniref:putative late blight resistance protein homolog R1A-3 n=1 Tax=Nicotiana attenuata TaxID=49451 RepID=UPI000905B1C1|nr:PREDICTED: putative late blight resistance protein homolog R1A-3 [Nicotiana attenuata]
MVGYNIEQANMLSQLTRDSPELEVISVTGMGGIGKSTFAKKLFSHPSVLSFFDIRGWVTVSEDYSYRNMLLGLLEDANIGKEEDLDKKSDSDLAVCLKQSLMGRRYLIVVDDIWSKNAWDTVYLREVVFLWVGSNGMLSLSKIKNISHQKISPIIPLTGK